MGGGPSGPLDPGFHLRSDPLSVGTSTCIHARARVKAHLVYPSISPDPCSPNEAPRDGPRGIGDGVSGVGCYY